MNSLLDDLIEKGEGMGFLTPKRLHFEPAPEPVIEPEPEITIPIVPMAPTKPYTPPEPRPFADTPENIVVTEPPELTSPDEWKKEYTSTWELPKQKVYQPTIFQRRLEMHHSYKGSMENDLLRQAATEIGLEIAQRLMDDNLIGITSVKDMATMNDIYNFECRAILCEP